MTDQPVIVITGTRKGIGRQLAEHYLANGYAVVGCSREPVEPPPAGYHHFCLDVADEPAVKEMFSAVRKRFARLDAVINNAGIASMNHALLTPLATVERVLRTNVAGTFLFCREAAQADAKGPARAHRESDHGRRAAAPRRRVGLRGVESGGGDRSPASWPANSARWGSP